MRKSKSLNESEGKVARKAIVAGQVERRNISKRVVM
jgi:hypothetical protein